MQRSAIARLAGARGDLVRAWYAETFSSATTQRPELARLRAEVRAGHCWRVYVYRLDRLTRSGIRDTLELVEEFRRHGCELVSVADGFDVGGPAADVVLAVLAWAAQMERAAITERLVAARVRVEAEGKTWGRPKRLTADQESELRALHRAGNTIRDISVKLGISRGTVGRTLELCPENPPPNRSRNH
jgi:DNA invertase Pin-like site-specific DNA recombinase